MLKVSIIVPVYNSEQYLTECLNSLLSHSYENIEIICIDDGSSDNSWLILENFAKNNNCVKIFKQNNAGPFNARLEGIKKSDGDYLMFIDSDDWIDNNTVELLINLIEKYECDIVKFRFVMEPKKEMKIEEFDKKIGFRDEVLIDNDKSVIFESFINNYFFNNLSNEIVKKSLAEGINSRKNLIQGEDALMNYTLFTKAERILVSKLELYHYRNNTTSTTRSINIETIKKSIESQFLVSQELVNFLPIWNMHDEKNVNSITLSLLTHIFAKYLLLCKAKLISYVTFKSTFNKIKDFNNSCFILNSLVKDDFKESPIKRHLKQLIYHGNTFRLYLYYLLIHSIYFIKP